MLFKINNVKPKNNYIFSFLFSVIYYEFLILTKSIKTLKPNINNKLLTQVFYFWFPLLSFAKIIIVRSLLILFSSYCLMFLRYEGWKLIVNKFFYRDSTSRRSVDIHVYMLSCDDINDELFVLKQNKNRYNWLYQLM